MKKVTIAAAISALAAGILGHPVAATSAGPSGPSETVVTATFEGQQFDMVDGWGAPESLSQIGACHVTETDATCFRTEAEMITAIDKPAASNRAANCGSSLRLYDGTGHTGAVLSLTQRGSILSLSSYGFNNRTSSYRIGACSSTFYNGIGSSPYPGNTSAYASASSMYSGWSNTISSVYLS